MSDREWPLGVPNRVLAQGMWEPLPEPVIQPWVKPHLRQRLEEARREKPPTMGLTDMGNKTLGDVKMDQRDHGMPCVYDRVEDERWVGEEPILSKDWIGWGGGSCPLDYDTEVEVMFQSGKTNDSFTVGDWCWEHNFGSRRNIIAYRVVE